MIENYLAERTVRYRTGNMVIDRKCYSVSKKLCTGASVVECNEYYTAMLVLSVSEEAVIGFVKVLTVLSQ